MDQNKRMQIMEKRTSEEIVVSDPKVLKEEDQESDSDEITRDSPGRSFSNSKTEVRQAPN